MNHPAALSLMDIGVHHFVVLSVLVGAAGIATMLTKRNAIGILIGVELVLNAAAVNFAAFNRFLWGQGGDVSGQVFSLFIIVLAAAEAAVALAIFLNFYHNFNTIDVEQADQMKG